MSRTDKAGLIVSLLRGCKTTDVDSPCEKPGVAVSFLDCSVLLAGRDDTRDRGVIARYTKNAEDVMVLADTYTFAGGDVIGLVHDDVNNKLYMLDLGHREIRSAAYTVGSAIPTSWTTVATTTTVPFLASAGLCDLTLFLDPATPSWLLIGHHHFRFAEDFAWIDLNGPTQTVRPGTNAWAHLDEGGDHLVGATTLAFEAPAGAQVDIVRVVAENSWVVIGSGTAGPTGKGIAKVEPLQFGDYIAAKRRELPFPTPPFLTTTLRTGVPGRLDAESKLRPLCDSTGYGFYAGNEAFSIWLGAEGRENPFGSATHSASYHATLAVGTPGDIKMVNGHYYVDTLTQISTALSGNIAEADLPIPDEQQLVGLVFVVQWWVALPWGNVACSDILHMIMRADEPDVGNYGAMFACPGTPAAASSRTRTTRVPPRLTVKKWSSFGRQRGMDLLTKGNKAVLPRGEAELRLKRLRSSLRR